MPIFFRARIPSKQIPLVKRYGNDPQGFRAGCRTIGGYNIEMADAAFCLKPFPKIPVYYVLWAGDEEFPAKLSVLFDRSVELHLSADAIWGLVGLVSDALLNT